MVDLGLGEVYGPEIFGEKPEKAIRSCREIEEHLRTVYGTTAAGVYGWGVAHVARDPGAGAPPLRGAALGLYQPGGEGTAELPPGVPRGLRG